MSQVLLILIGFIFVVKQVEWSDVIKVSQQIKLSAFIKILTLNKDTFIRNFIYLYTFSLCMNFSTIIGTNPLTQNTMLLHIFSFGNVFN
jgi:Na+-driven multidrug efflux pump